jgi:hypothetical protein
MKHPFCIEYLQGDRANCSYNVDVASVYTMLPRASLMVNTPVCSAYKVNYVFLDKS